MKGLDLKDKQTRKLMAFAGIKIIDNPPKPRKWRHLPKLVLACLVVAGIGAALFA